MSSTSTAIEWTDKTWNPTVGCDKVSAGCRNCYAEALTKRFTNHFKDGFDFTLHPERLREPRRWRKPSRVFVNSMSDLFHAKVPLGFIRDIFDVMRETPQHTYQALTKRSLRMARLADRLDWPANLWMGVSVEDETVTGRIDHLREVPAAVRFLSCEPLIGPLRDLDLAGIDWVIAGGESGANHRPMDQAWVEDIRDQCVSADVAFFFKQWGGRTPKANGRLLEGRTWDEMPTSRAALAG